MERRVTYSAACKMNEVKFAALYSRTDHVWVEIEMRLPHFERVVNAQLIDEVV